MRFTTFMGAGESAAQPGIALQDGTIAALGDLYPSMLALIDAGEAGLDAARAREASPAKTYAASDARLLAPVPQPRRMRDCMVYEKHLQQSAREGMKLTGETDPVVTIPEVWYRQPIYYKSNHLSVIGPDTDIRWPTYAQAMDFELEIAVVIGRKACDPSPAEAEKLVFGYTIFNDVSARDTQMTEMAGQLGPAKGKDFDTGNVLGPFLVTPDEVGDVQGLKANVRVNGKTMAETSTAGMQHDVGHVLAHMAASETIYPGEVVGLGTLGDGCLLEQGIFLQPDDLIELEVEKLGILRNRIVKGAHRQGGMRR